MSVRELVVLGTASQAPTRSRNQNGYLLRWDAEGLLFDPGEGTQRQMLFAGVSTHDVTRICVTHFHGDHCLGLPGVIQRLSLDRVPHPVDVHFPASGTEFFERLRHASSFHEVAALVPHPLDGERVTLPRREHRGGLSPELSAVRLSHPVESYGYRLVEPDGRRMLADRLVAAGISGPDVGRIQRLGELTVAGRRVRLAEVSEPRRGSKFAFVMDTRLCDGAFALAEGADMLVCEATFLHEDADMAETYGHLTAGQAGRIAAESGVRRLVLTHFSQRYGEDSAARFAGEAARTFTGDIVLAEDLARIPVPSRS